MSATSIDTEIERYLRSGAHDTLAPVWSGGSIIERGANANGALRDALVAEVLRRTRHTTVPDGLDDADLVTLTRTKVAPMVEGLFPAAEQTTVLDMLARSVVYLTPRNIERGWVVG